MYKLSKLAAVNWVYLDAQVVSTTLTTETVRDEFNTYLPSGNNGSRSWSSDWQEINESDGLRFGDVRIQYDRRNRRLQIQDNDGGGEGVQRQVDLSGATKAIFTFDYRRVNRDNPDDYVSIEISVDNGGNWIELDRFAGPGSDRYYQSWGADISEYIAPQTTIRFLSSANLGRNDRVFYDNVQIEFTSGEIEEVQPPAEEPEPFDPIEMKLIADDFEGVPYTFANSSGTRNWTGEWLEGRRIRWSRRRNAPDHLKPEEFKACYFQRAA